MAISGRKNPCMVMGELLQPMRPGRASVCVLFPVSVFKIAIFCTLALSIEMTWQREKVDIRYPAI